MSGEQSRLREWAEKLIRAYTDPIRKSHDIRLSKMDPLLADLVEEVRAPLVEHRIKESDRANENHERWRAAEEGKREAEEDRERWRRACNSRESYLRIKELESGLEAWKRGAKDELTAAQHRIEALEGALRGLLNKLGEPGGECDHPRRSCDDVGCFGPEVKVARVALSAQGTEPAKCLGCELHWEILVVDGVPRHYADVYSEAHGRTDDIPCTRGTEPRPEPAK
jgi:hypothetical protein